MQAVAKLHLGRVSEPIAHGRSLENACLKVRSDQQKDQIMKPSAIFLAALASCTMLTACGQSKPADTSGSQAVSATYASLSAAAEPFEALTEQAFTAGPGKLAALYKEAESAARKIEPQLDSSTTTELDSALANAKAAIDTKKPADIALSAVEGYRLIVSQFPADSKIPPAVSLLDYAGFRMQADLQTDPVRWDDLKTALSFANEQWSSVSPKIAKPAVASNFAVRLADLQSALDIKDVAAAKTAASRELDEVDALETYFSTQPAN